jgi:hypothetical protein
MATIREQILEAAVTALNTSRPTGVPTCVRTQMLTSEQDQLPAMTLFPFREEVRHDASGRFGPIITRTMYMRVVIYAQGNPADAALDDSLAWVTQCLSGQQFGGLATDTMEHEAAWQYNESNFAVAAIAVDFRVEYQTLRADQTKIR